MIENQKHLFNIPEEVTYLNCAYMSPQLKSISEEGRKSLLKKEQPWQLEPSDFFNPPQELKSLFAQIINANKEQIALIPSVSYGIETAARNVIINRGSNIVVIAEQFPSNIYSWYELAKIKGAEIITVNKADDTNWTKAILSSINNKTAVVALPQVHWTDGSFIDLLEIRQRCDQVNAALVVDATQSVGAFPFDVQIIKPDFLVTAAYKWLLGPYSLGYLYVDPKYNNGIPLEYNWMNRAGSENFSKLVNYTNEFQAGAMRFEMGEKSNFVLLPMAKVALEQILKWGVNEIAQTLSVLTEYAEEKAKESGLSVFAIPNRAGHLMGIRFAQGVPQELVQKLKNEKISVSIRGNSIRVAPHLYNDKNDFDKLFTAINNYKLE